MTVSNPSAGVFPDSLPGIIAPRYPLAVTAAGGVVTAGRVYLHRVVSPAPLTVVSIALAVTAVATVDDAAQVGIYGLSPSDSTSLVLLGSCPLTNGKLNALGLQTFTLTTPVALTAGIVYYAAFLCPTIGGTSASIALAQIANSAFWSCFGATSPNALFLSISGAASLPASITTPGVVGTAGGIELALRPF